MKSFFKFTLASIVGFILAGIILMFVSMGIIGGIVSTAQDDTVTIKKKTVLTIDLSKGVVDRASSNPFEEMNFQTFKPENKVGLNAILKNLKKAKDDENIKGIYINSPGVNAGTGTLEEIRNAILDFKTSGKFVISYADAYSQSSYYLATASDKIYLNPEGLVDFKGLSSQLMFFRDALDKLGVEPIIIRVKTTNLKVL
jgi:protease-4